PSDPFEQAVRFFYLNRSAISKGNADAIPKTGWRHSTTSNQNPANGYLTACEMIKDFADRMRGVMIERLDFAAIIEKYDAPDALFYVDPPYIGREKFYAGGFTLEDHYKLGALLNQVKGKVLLSYYDDPLIAEIYGGWTIETH